MFAHQLFGTGSLWEVRHLNLCLTACVKKQRRFPNEWISRRVTSAAPSAPLAEPKWIFQPNKLCFFFFTRNDHFFYSVGAKQAATLFRLLKKKVWCFSRSPRECLTLQSALMSLQWWKLWRQKLEVGADVWKHQRLRITWNCCLSSHMNNNSSVHLVLDHAPFYCGS